MSSGQALLWNGRVTLGLGDPAESSVAYGLNDHGDVAGDVSVSSIPFVWQAVLWRRATRG